MIYFVKAGQFVKIGVSDNPGKRIKELQVGNPYKLELLGVIPGDEQEETEIHDAFADHHSHGEWYFYSKPVRVFIKFAVGAPVEKVVLSAKSNPAAHPPDSRPGWRIEVFTNRKGYRYWQWRRGSGKDREAVYGGTFDTKPDAEAVAT